MVFQTLNKLKWTNKLDRCSVKIRHRGGLNDEKLILGKQITEVKRTYFNYMGEEETTIPNHRVLEIRLDGKVIWKRKKTI